MRSLFDVENGTIYHVQRGRETPERFMEADCSKFPGVNGHTESNRNLRAVLKRTGYFEFRPRRAAAAASPLEQAFGCDSAPCRRPGAMRAQQNGAPSTMRGRL